MLLPPNHPPALEVDTVEVDTVEVDVRGDLDYEATAELRARIDRAFDLARTSVLLDCSRVRFTDTGGLRLLLEATRVADARGLCFVIARPSRSLRHLLRLAGVSEFLHIDGQRPSTQLSSRAVVESRGAAIHGFPVAHAL
jgi:anti-anti-sigma factor